MTSKFLLAGALAVLAVAGSAGSSYAQQTPYQRGVQIGQYRGYAPFQVDCFARIFARRATLSPQGGWVMDPDAVFSDELWKRCRISR